MKTSNAGTRKALAVLLALLLFIPTVAAVVSYNIEKNKPISTDNVCEMKLVDVNGAEFLFERTDTALDYNSISSNMIAFFLEMNENSAPESELPEPLRGTRYYKAVFKKYQTEFSYRYYFTNDAAGCYYLDDKENCYLLPQDYVLAFFKTEWAMSLFEGANPPVMTLANGDIIPFDTVDWVYHTVGDGLSEYKKGSLGADKASHTISESVKLSFSYQPDFVSVAIKGADGSDIFSGMYEDIGMAVIQPNTDITVSVSAQWHENEEKTNSYGTATYNFTARFTDAPEFLLSQKAINPGEFTVLTIKNVQDASTIKFSSEPSINYTPVFFRDGSCYRAFIPVSYELDYSPNYTFSVSSDGVDATLVLIVSEKTFASRSTDISAEIANRTRTEATINEFNSNMAAVYATRTETKYFDGKFMDATGSSGNDGVVRTGYAIFRSVTSQGITYRHNGVDYRTSIGDPVYAVNSGIVTYVGEQTLSGKTVVIDHGFGLMSTYCHLGDIKVNIGDVVTTRQQIATAGNGGFTDGGNIHVTLSVFNVPVSIYPLWDNGVVLE